MDLRDYHDVCVCVCEGERESLKLKIWPIFMKLYMNIVANEDVMLLISHRE